MAVPSNLTPTQIVTEALKWGGRTVPTSALAHMPRPWFGLDFDKDGMLSVSDDAWFCQQAARIGIETWCDPTIDAKHIGEYEY